MEMLHIGSYLSIGEQRTMGKKNQSGTPPIEKWKCCTFEVIFQSLKKEKCKRHFKMEFRQRKKIGNILNKLDTKGR